MNSLRAGCALAGLLSHSIPARNAVREAIRRVVLRDSSDGGWLEDWSGIAELGVITDPNPAVAPDKHVPGVDLKYEERIHAGHAVVGSKEPIESVWIDEIVQWWEINGVNFRGFG